MSALTIAFATFVAGGFVSCTHFVIEEELSLLLLYAVGGVIAFGGFHLAMKTDVGAARKGRRKR